MLSKLPSMVTPTGEPQSVNLIGLCWQPPSDRWFCSLPTRKRLANLFRGGRAPAARVVQARPRADSDRRGRPPGPYHRARRISSYGRSAPRWRPGAASARDRLRGVLDAAPHAGTAAAVDRTAGAVKRRQQPRRSARSRSPGSACPGALQLVSLARRAAACRARCHPLQRSDDPPPFHLEPCGKIKSGRKGKSERRTADFCGCGWVGTVFRSHAQVRASMRAQAQVRVDRSLFQSIHILPIAYITSRICIEFHLVMITED
jgi:hypothetical protein